MLIMEEIDQESMKHMYKLCDKSFSCERLLGGHMMINSSNDQNEMENKSVFDKLCEKCGKGFQSWKALFGHMKCHSTKLLSNKNKNIASFRQNSCASHSYNENSYSKKRRIKISRSRSRNKRYMVASNTTSSSISMSVNNNNQISINNASTSMVSEIEQEQEVDVAMSLMMLSRDLGKWGNELESSYLCNSSVFVNLGKVEGKDLTKNGSKMKKQNKIKHKPMLDHDQTTKGYDSKACDIHQEASSFNLGGHKASHKKKLEGGFDTKTKIKHKPMLDHDQTTKGYDSKTCDIHQEASSFNLGGVGFSKKKTVVFGTYECPICYKIFASGQALGGHKRAHLNQEMTTNVTKKTDEHLQKTRGFFDLNMFPEEDMNMTNITMNQDYY